MKYADYRIEDLVFLKKETEKWNINEKREFLETCPENAGLVDTITQLKEVRQAIKDGVIKVNRYHEINKNSMKSYLARHKTAIKYGQPEGHYYYSDSKDFYINLDGTHHLINRDYDMSNIIEYFEDDSRIEHRFNIINSYYYKRETNWSKNIEEKRYNAVNADQIRANKELDKVLDALRVEIPTEVNVDKWGYGSCEKAKLMGYDFPYSHNNYGEILVNNKPLTENQATELMNTIFEMSSKINDIINEYKDTIGAALGKGAK